MLKRLTFLLIIVTHISCFDSSEYVAVKKVAPGDDAVQSSNDFVSESENEPSMTEGEIEQKDPQNTEQDTPQGLPGSMSESNDPPDGGDGDGLSGDEQEKEQDEEQDPVPPELISTYFMYVAANDRVYHYELAHETGTVSQKSVFMLNNNANPDSNFNLQLAVAKEKQYLYVGTAGTNIIQTLAINQDDGSLSLVGTLDLPFRPVYLHVDDSGSFLIVSSYANNKVEVLPIADDGQPTLDTQNNRELSTGNRAHSVITSPNNDYIIFPNTGGQGDGDSKLQGADFDPITGMITGLKDLTTSNGDGPRHIRFHPTLSVFYAVNEYADSVSWYSWDATGHNLIEGGSRLTLPASSQDNTCADIHLTSDGRFLYASNRDIRNRGNHSIAMFAVDPQNGSLTPIEGERVASVGKPREFAIDPLDKYLFVLGRDQPYRIQSFSINQGNGQLDLIQAYDLEASPTWVEFVELVKEVPKI